ncbi:uncharacterized protein [Typha angustifolia]|uniref:uncharacterized protein n=1 Tax=Typha angustifolia TaxID=59011 RepID=UPI003C2F6B71
MAASETSRSEKKPRSLFDLPSDFFNGCRLLRAHPSEILPPIPSPPPSSTVDGEGVGEEEAGLDSKREPEKAKETSSSRCTCNICKAEFDSFHDQRSHFKSDLHRLNVKLSIAGKNTIKEEDFDELDTDSLFEDMEISSISGSEDELENGPISNQGLSGKGREEFRQKLYFRFNSGDTVSVYRCLLLDESEEPFGNNKLNVGISGCTSYVEDTELINRLKHLISEPRDKRHLRIVLLACGGHFAGCVFDGNSIIAHKTFHRYVVRAKAGRKQSAKDATGKAANSAGSSLRRHNEAALKKEIQELIVSWKPYFDSCSSVFLHAPSKNRQLLFDGEKPNISFHGCNIQHVPLTVHRPTLKEVKRVYNQLTYITYEIATAVVKEVLPSVDDESSIQHSDDVKLDNYSELVEPSSKSCSSVECLPSNNEVRSLSFTESETTPLHEAAKSGDAQRTLELLEQGLNPCIKDSRGRTAYMMATEKEVRNTFRRYMALNLDKWDWHAANVPSPLTKEMEESQAAKQAEKDAKRKAKAKELKKLKKAKEKAKAQASPSQNAQPAVSHSQAVVPVSAVKQQPQSSHSVTISKEEEQKRALAEAREKRAAAAERRIAALTVQASSTTAAPASSLVEPKGGPSDITCSCCNASLAGKVPFHRYHYKYCSTSCMHVHREILEDG